MNAPRVDDCWNRIGVRGDVSCPELTRHQHCHNCPVHAAAALALLDQEPPAGTGAGWTAHFAQPLPVAAPGTVSIFVFRVGAHWLGVATATVLEVAPERTIHTVPQRRHGPVLGVVNVHGSLRVCLSLAAVLQLEAVATGPQTRPFVRERMLMLQHGDVRAACPVDEISGIHRVPPSALADAPASAAGAGLCATRVWPWNGHAVGILDDALLGQALRRSLA
jgi:chemotaxis-related protein WspD